MSDKRNTFECNAFYVRIPENNTFFVDESNLLALEEVCGSDELNTHPTFGNAQRNQLHVYEIKLNFSVMYFA